MALDYIQGFADWDIANLAYEIPGATGTLSIVDGARSGESKALRAVGNATVPFSVSSASTKYLCVRFKRVSGVTDYASVKFMEGSTPHVSIVFATDYSLKAVRGEAAGTVLSSVASAYSANTWVQLVIKVVVHDTTGTVEVRVNGSTTPIIVLTGQDTRNGLTGVIDAISIVNAGSDTVEIMDLAAWTDSGETPNGWVKDTRVDTYLVNGAGSSTQYTPSAGANYQCVDEVQSDGDTTYNQSSTNGHVDLFTLANMTHVPSTIHAVAVTVVASKTAEGAATVKAKLKAGATTVAGSEQTLNFSTYNRGIFAKGTNPDTSLPFTISDVNALEIGYESVIS